MRRIVIVGGGYAGFYTAWRLEKRLGPREAELVIIDPRPYMTYQPFLPEVAAGSIEARHAAVSLRSHLRRTRIISGAATMIRHAEKTVTVRPVDGPDVVVDYDIIVVTAGAVTRVLPIPGADEVAIGMKHVEEAVAIRDRLLTAFDRASVLEAGPERNRLLTFAFVGGGFSGVEGFGELLSLATALLKRYPEIGSSELSFHLVEANDRILPEVTAAPGRWVVDSLRARARRGRARRAHGAERAARRAPGQAARGEHRGDPSRRPNARLPSRLARRRGHARTGPGHLPVQAARHHGPARLADAPRLPRARDPDLGAEAARARRLAHGTRDRSRHRLAALGAGPSRRVRGRGRPRPASSGEGPHEDQAGVARLGDEGRAIDAMSSSIATEKTWMRTSPTPTGIHRIPRWRIAPLEYTTRGT